MEGLEKLRLEMDARGFMPKTKKAYMWYNQNFLDFAGKRPEDVGE